MLLLDWFAKPKPRVYDVPGVGPKPVRDWTDEDVEAVARPFRERAEQAEVPVGFDFTRLVLQMREEEREWLATSRLELGLARLGDWWDQIWWRLRGHRHDFGDGDADTDVDPPDGEAQIVVDVYPPDLLERSRFTPPE